MEDSLRAFSMILMCLAWLTLSACNEVSGSSQPSHQYTLQIATENAETTALIDPSAEVLVYRLKQMGIKVHSVTKEGSDRLIIAVSGEEPQKKIKAAIGRQAKLEIRLVDETADSLDLEDGIVPVGSKILPMTDGSPPLAVKRLGGIDGKHIQNALPGFDRYSDESILSIKFDDKGGRKFARMTTDNVGGRLAIVLDDEIVSAPYIREPILGGEVQIAGGLTPEAANDLAIMLNSGALPAELLIIEVREFQ